MASLERTATPGPTSLFRGGWNAVQVQKFLGHSDPGFTLRTYVHLLPEDLPATDFLAQVGNTRGAAGYRPGPNLYKKED